MREPKRIKADERISFSLSRQARDLILERTFIDPALEKRLRLALASGSKLVTTLTLNDVEELAGSVAAEANHCDDPKIERALDAVYDRLAKLEAKYTYQESADAHAKPVASSTARSCFTAKQGQYLTFIYYYTKIHRTPPAEADLQQYFRVSPSAVHQMILTLESRALIERDPGQPRSIRLQVSRTELPDLD